MDRQEVIVELLRYQEQFNLATENLARDGIALVNDQELAEELRLSAITSAPEGALDGKNEAERKQKMELLLAQDEAYNKQSDFVRQDEREIVKDHANVEIARMGIRVLETIAKLLEPLP